MSEFRVEKRREAAQLTLTSGSTLSGFFFLSGSSPDHTGSERVGDLLNFDDGFFPFEMETGTSVINRTHVLKVTLPATVIEANLDPAYQAATRKRVTILLTNGEEVSGVVSVVCPPGHERLSDFARLNDRFRYVELPDQTVLVNSLHIVAMSEAQE